MTDRDWRFFGFGVCTGATATLFLSMIFWWLGVGS